MTDDYTQAEIVRTLKRIETGQQELAAKVDAQGAQYVRKDEWEAWRTGIGREIGDIKASISARNTPWTTIALVVVAITSLAVSVVPHLA